MLPNIVLVGFMGCGKSSVGRRLAGKCGHRFVDTDDLVTARAGRTITQIFQAEGEAHFRDLETAELRELEHAAGLVLATGGGLVLRAENRERLQRLGAVFWLDAEPDALFERVSRNRKRPLLQTGDPRRTFDALLAERRPIYESVARRRVDSTGLSHDDVARLILEEAGRIAPDPAAPGFGS